MLTVGIYGFNITKVTHFSFGTIFPVIKSASEITKNNANKNRTIPYGLSRIGH